MNRIAKKKSRKRWLNLAVQTIPYWMHSAIFHVRARHAAAGIEPASFGDQIREAKEHMLREKGRLGVK
jgi:hypothetical protein